MTEAEPIDAEDLYAAYQLQELAKQFKFGRGASVQVSRRQTRFLYYFVAIELLRDVLIRGNHQTSAKGITNAFHVLLQDTNQAVLQLLLDAAIEVVDDYLRQDSDDSVFKEQEFEGDLNSWFKSETLGKGGERTYRLNSLLTTHKAIFGRSAGSQPSPRTLVNQAMTNAHS